MKSYILVIYWYFVGIGYVTFAYEPNSWDVILLIEATVYYAFGLTFVEVLVVVLHAFFFSTNSVLSLNACVGVILHPPKWFAHFFFLFCIPVFRPEKQMAHEGRCLVALTKPLSIVSDQI